MKRKTKVQPPKKTAEVERLEKLMDMALDRYNFTDIVNAFFSGLRNYGMFEELAEAITEDYKLKAEVKKALQSEIEEEYIFGKAIIQIETLEQEMKLRDFVNSQLFPYYNQQQTQLFA